MARAWPPDDTVDSPTRVWPPASAAGGGLEYESFLFADAVASGDPNNINNNSVAGAVPGFIQFNIDTPGVARLPDATTIGGVYYEWPLPASWGASDIASALAYVLEDTPPTDTYVAIAVTSGGVATIGNGGVLAGIEFNASGWRAFTMINAGAGAGWITKTNATATDQLVRGVQMQVGQGNATANVRVHAVAIEAGGRQSSTSGAVPSAQSGNAAADGVFTRIALVCGWSGIGGAANATINASLRALVNRVRQISAGVQYLTPQAANFTVPPNRIAIIGDSNGNGTQIDATKGGLVIATTNPGWTVRDVGVNLANWPATGTPGTGMVPYLLDDLTTAAVPAGWVLRRSTNGADTNWPGSIRDQVINAIADATALGADPQALIWVMGANDAQDLPEATAFLDNLRRACESARAAWPHVRMFFCLEESLLGAGGGYAYLRNTSPTIASALATLAAEFGGRVVDPGLGIPHADDIHWSSTGTGSGQDVLAAAVATALLSPPP